MGTRLLVLNSGAAEVPKRILSGEQLREDGMSSLTGHSGVFILRMVAVL
jgi:hypothetical protein